jgi:hypothetical protein
MSAHIGTSGCQRAFGRPRREACSRRSERLSKATKVPTVHYVEWRPVVAVGGEFLLAADSVRRSGAIGGPRKLRQTGEEPGPVRHDRDVFTGT